MKKILKVFVTGHGCCGFAILIIDLLISALPFTLSGSNINVQYDSSCSAAEALPAVADDSVQPQLSVLCSPYWSHLGHPAWNTDPCPPSPPLKPADESRALRRASPRLAKSMNQLTATVAWHRPDLGLSVNACGCSQKRQAWRAVNGRLLLDCGAIDDVGHNTLCLKSLVLSA